MLIFFGLCMFLLGACLNTFFQMYCSLGHIYYYWNVLLKYALKERECLLVLLPPESEASRILMQQKLWLEQIALPKGKKDFQTSGSELLKILVSIEEKLNEILLLFLQNDSFISENSSEKRNEDLSCALENFWAVKNLFDFQANGYHLEVEKYCTIQKKTLASFLSIFFSYPKFPLQIPSFD